MLPCCTTLWRSSSLHTLSVWPAHTDAADSHTARICVQKGKINKARNFKLTSRLTICLSRSPSWFLKAWISAVAGLSLGSRALITYETEQRSPELFFGQQYSHAETIATHITGFFQVQFVPLLHGPHVIIFLLQSSHQLIHLHSCRRTRFTSVTLPSGVDVYKISVNIIWPLHGNNKYIHVWELSCWRSSSSSFFFMISSWASFSWTLQAQTLFTYCPLLEDMGITLRSHV